jgi:FkbM family methyltransferase
MLIESLIVDLSHDPFNPELNYSVAVEYQNQKQTASAVSFYLRTAEYGYETHPHLVYESLLSLAKCFNDQNDRLATVSNTLLQAIAYQPKFTKGYLKLSEFYESQKNWQECYTYACIGESLNSTNNYKFIFQKAVSAWWLGREEEAVTLFKRLYSIKDKLESGYRAAVLNNIQLLGIVFTPEIDPLEPVVMNYRKFFGSSAKLIIDIGTRDGDDANYLFESLNGNKVIAIDANPEGAELTKVNYPWMDVKFSAIADTEGSTTFYQVSSNNKELVGCSSIFSKETAMYPEHFANNTKPITVPMTRIDTLLKDTEGLIDVVKVDTEGYTWQVLQGFGKRLKDVKVFHLETERERLHDTHVTYEAVISFMETNGFVLVDTSYEWGWGIQDQVWVNPALAIRNKECFTTILESL